ncbi:MAG: tRNA guanosine(34) transglycosylase Tgt [Alphaproteobacteria bacterium]|nr:tRNA guanosine(34) transglycosylase Tgt [Alphaproteobacteria bacterium]
MKSSIQGNENPFFTIHTRSNTYPLMRAGTIHTPHGAINTPAFIPVGTKGTVKALTVDQLISISAQAVLANTYHLYLQPGENIVCKHGGVGSMMKWDGPTMTDSGGFQVFSLGQAMGHGVSKIATNKEISEHESRMTDEASVHTTRKAKIDDDGVTFQSVIDGSTHRFTPESSIQIQHDIGADIIVAFDECTSPLAPEKYQKEALHRTHSWAERCVHEHKRLGLSAATDCKQALYGVVQGGVYPHLRKESALFLSKLDFDGFAIGGSFTKEDMHITLTESVKHLPENKPRHFLGIGGVEDFFIGIENGMDTFDCVAATRVARNGSIYTKNGSINITNATYRDDVSLIDTDQNNPSSIYTKSYLHHLFKAKEILGYTIATMNNLYFIINLVAGIRNAIISNTYDEYKTYILSNWERDSK